MSWGATATRAGVDVVPALSRAAAYAVVDRVQRAKRTGDTVAVSIHGDRTRDYEVSRDQFRVAHRLMNGGVDVVRGHSLHHLRPEYRDDLLLLSFVSVEPGTGRLAGLSMTPMQAGACGDGLPRGRSEVTDPGRRARRSWPCVTGCRRGRCWSAWRPRTAMGAR